VYWDHYGLFPLISSKTAKILVKKIAQYINNTRSNMFKKYAGILSGVLDTLLHILKIANKISLTVISEKFVCSRSRLYPLSIVKTL